MPPIRHTAVVVPGVSPDILPWDKHPIPPLLYKYLPPERFHVLTDSVFRFSQRGVFEDTLDLRPAVAHFGSEDEIRQFMQNDATLMRHPPMIREAVIRHVLDNPDREAAFIRQTQKWFTAPEAFGVFCLTENPASDRMWQQYAGRNCGFVIEFETTHRAFAVLLNLGRIGKVEYSDEPFPSLLSTYGVNAFFRKSMQYQFEAEWRVIRPLSRFAPTLILNPESALPIYRAYFDPACIRTILIRGGCILEWELRNLAAVDCRYRHVEVRSV